MTKNPTEAGLVLYSNQRCLGERTIRCINCVDGPLYTPIPTTFGKE